MDIFVMLVITYIRNNNKKLNQQLLFSLKMYFQNNGWQINLLTELFQILYHI